MFKFLFKNFGMLTILMIQVINILLGYFLGIFLQSDNNKSKTNLFVESLKVIDQMDTSNKKNVKNIIIDKQSTVLSSNENSLFLKESNSNSNNYEELSITLNYINRRKESNIDMEYLNTVYGKQGKQNLINKIKFIYYSILEIVFIYIILNIVILLFSIIDVIFENKNIKNNKDYNIIQNKNGEWVYKCNIETLDFSLNMIYLLIYISIIQKSVKLLKYEYIFKSTKYISYTVLISIIFGPSINVLYPLKFNFFFINFLL